MNIKRFFKVVLEALSTNPEELIKKQEQEQEERLTKEVLAFAVLLIDMALVDNNFDINEHEWIKAKLTKFFRISLDKVYEAMYAAKEVVNESNDINFYIRYLKENVSAKKREQILNVLEEFIHVDREINPFEVKLMEKYEQLLGVRIK